MIAYALAVCCYQIGRLSEDPTGAVAWIGLSAAMVIGAYLWLIRLGKRRALEGRLIPVVNL